jgi:hypothetical protein
MQQIISERNGIPLGFTLFSIMTKTQWDSITLFNIMTKTQWDSNTLFSIMTKTQWDPIAFRNNVLHVVHSSSYGPDDGRGLTETCPIELI